MSDNQTSPQWCVTLTIEGYVRAVSSADAMEQFKVRVLTGPELRNEAHLTGMRARKVGPLPEEPLPDDSAWAPHA